MMRGGREGERVRVRRTRGDHELSFHAYVNREAAMRTSERLSPMAKGRPRAFCVIYDLKS
jgi:hypothetical protein